MKARKNFIIHLLLFMLLFWYCSYTVAVPKVNAAADESIQEEILDLIENNYYGEVSIESFGSMTVQEIMSQLDVYSGYYDASGVKAYEEALSGEYKGIGIQIIQRDNNIVIKQVIEGTPAFHSNILVGDKILEVGGVDCDTMSIGEVAQLMGKHDEKNLILTIERDGVRGEHILQKEMIVPQDVIQAKMLTKDIGYVKITKFTRDVARKFDNASDIFEAGGVSKLVIDLRGNRGGLLSEAVTLCRRIIPKGIIVQIEDREGLRMTYDSYRKTSPFEVVVLVDHVTASASEIVTAAIVESGIGISIGTKTYGKGYVQKVYKLSNGEYFRLTTAQYFTGKGMEVQGIGLEPVICISTKDNDEDQHIQGAITYLNEK